MISNILKFVLDKLARLAAYCAAFFWAFRKGKAQNELENLEAEKRGDKKARIIHHNVITDIDYRERVRREFDGS